MKKWYFLACILVILGVYHSIFDDIQQRMIATFSKANVGDVYNLSDFTKGSVYSLMGINYVDFRHPTDIEYSYENIMISYGHGKQKVINTLRDEDTDLSPNQVLLKADRREIPFGYRCPLNTKIQLVHHEPVFHFYYIKPLNCQLLTE